MQNSQKYLNFKMT